MNFKTNIRRQIPFIISTLIALSAVFVYFINPPSQIPDKKLLSIEYNRIAASDTVPYLFKMMEGTYLVKEEAYGEQYTLKDEKGRTYGLVTNEFKMMWEKWSFKHSKPLNNLLWRSISASDSMNNFIGFLNVKAQTDATHKIENYAKNYLCFYYYSTLNEDGDGWFSSGVSENIYNLNMDELCKILNIDPYNFYYTAAIITNTSDKPIDNIRLYLKEMSKGNEEDSEKNYTYYLNFRT